MRPAPSVSDPRNLSHVRRWLKGVVGLLVLCALPDTGLAQPVVGTRARAPRQTRTWADAVARDKTLPPERPNPPGAPSPNISPKPAHSVVPLREGVTPADTNPISRGGGGADGPCPIFVGSAVGVQFEALPDNLASIPPDTMGAIGPRHAMTMLNTQVRIQDRGGITEFSTVSLAAFWPDLSGPFDPKVYYDTLSQRWIAVCPGNPRSAASKWSIAVSLSDDPTGGWGWITLDADANDTRWSDYPCVGFNDKWIVVTYNMFAVPGAPMPGPTGPKMWVIDKAELLGPGPNVGYTVFDIGFVANGTTLQPAVCLDANVPDVMIVDGATFTDPVDAFPLLRISRITGPTASPTWQAIPGSAYTTPGLFKAPQRFTTELRTVPQNGSSTPIEVGTGRACNAIVRNGHMYFCHSGGGFFGGVPTNETLIYWYELEPTLPSPVTNWSSFGEGTGTGVFYPSIAVNCHGDIGIGYSRSSASINVSTGFAFIPAGNTGAATYTLAAGGSSYVRLDGNGRNRWGDYSATVVDPRDDMSFWTIQESAAATANRWTTRWSEFPHLCTSAPVINTQPQNSSFCPGSTLTLTVAASGSGNSYQWFRNGTQIVGAGAATLQVSNAVAAMSGVYHAIVTNTCGVTRSADALVRVGLSIAQQPADRSSAPCGTVTYTVGVAFPVGTVAYRWHKEFAPLGTNTPLNDDGHFSGTQTGTLTIQGVGYADEGRYTCRVFDPACTNVELFSQYAKCSVSDPSWTFRTSSGPLRRYSTDMVYDASRGVCVLYGGLSPITVSSVPNDETWEWDGVEWTRRFPAHNPGGRQMHELVYDSVRNKVLLFGGWPNGTNGTADVWQYDGNDWTLLTTSPGGPPTTHGTQGDAVFDPARGRMIVLTYNTNSGSSLNTTWEFSPVTLAWQMTYQGVGAYWYDSPLAYDPARNKVLGTSYAWYNLSNPHTWEYTGSGWTEVLNSQMPDRQDSVLAFDPFRQKVIMYGCCRNSHIESYGFFHNDTYIFDGATWSLHLPEYQPAFANRLQPAGIAFDSRRNAMVVVGNTWNTFVGTNPMDTWEYRYLDTVVFDRQPANQPLVIGSTTQFKVAAAGAGTLTFQWRKSGVPLTNGPTPSGSVISGAQTATLTMSNTTAADAGSYSCLVSNTCGSLASAAASLGSTCYANCDGSTGSPQLTANDFQCFINAYAAGSGYANCDGSTGTPALTANDFQCFINRYASGCS